MNIVGVYRDTESIPTEWPVDLQSLIKSCWNVRVCGGGGGFQKNTHECTQVFDEDTRLSPALKHALVSFAPS